MKEHNANDKQDASECHSAKHNQLARSYTDKTQAEARRLGA